MGVTAASSDFPCQICEVRDQAICGALDEAELRVLNAAATQINVTPRQAIFYEGDDAAYLFNVVSGTVRLSKSLPDGRRLITGFLFPGDFLGLSVGGVYSYAAEAVGAAALCRFERGRLQKILDELPKLEHRLLELASNELVEAQEQMMLLGRKSAVERLATVLLRMTRRIGHTRDGSTSLDIDFSRADLGDYLGLTTETVSRTFQSLQEQGLIHLPRARTIVIADEPGLRDLTGD